MKVQLLSSSSGQPLTLAEIKNHLRLSTGFTTDDTYIQALRDVAREHVEDYTGQKLRAQTWKLYLDEWPRDKSYDHVTLPFAPVQSVPSSGVVYRDAENNSTTFSSTAWNADTVSIPGRVVLEYDSDWPSVVLDNDNPISVEFVVGYTTPSSIPASIKHAMKMLIADMYEFHETKIIGQSVSPLNGGNMRDPVKVLLDKHRVDYLK